MNEHAPKNSDRSTRCPRATRVDSRRNVSRYEWKIRESTCIHDIIIFQTLEIHLCTYYDNRVLGRLREIEIRNVANVDDKREKFHNRFPYRARSNTH